MWTDISRDQGGLITAEQLRSSGLSVAQVRSLVSQRLLIRRRRGLYQAAAAEYTENTQLWYAVLATGGVVRGLAAAYLHDMRNELPAQIGVYIETGRHCPALVGVQCTAWAVPPSQRTTVRGLPVTTRQMTVLDGVAQLAFSEAVAFADRARTQGWVQDRDVQRRLAEQRRGNAQLRQVWQVVSQGGESCAERLLLDLLRRHGLTGWQAGYPVRAQGVLVARVDVAFPAEGLAIEVDGFAYHSNRQRFQHDRTRQNTLTSLGWKVIRFTWADLQERPDNVVGVVRSLVAGRA